MFKKVTILFILATSLAAQSVLDEYIDLALQKNLALKQADFSYQQSTAALKEARGMFLPSISLEARYTRAQGGRAFEFPIGDMLNPIYTTLNSLTGIPAFPTNLENEQFNFYREHEHETKVRVVQPLFQPKIYYNYKIQTAKRDIQAASRRAFARQLVADVKTAYYNYLTAIQVVELTQRTEKLLQENYRVSKRLFENEKATIDVVYRAEAELAKLEQEQAKAAKMQIMARAYFNFLLNRPQDAAIDKSIPTQATAHTPHLHEVTKHALAFREELEQLDIAIQAQKKGVNLQRCDFLPSLIVVFDYGYQGEKYNIDDDHDYWMGSAVLSWNLFHGGQDRAKIQQAQLEKMRLATEREHIHNKIKLDIRLAAENVSVAKESINSAQKTEMAAEKNFNIIQKKWQQGMVAQIEYLDAQHTLTQAELNTIMASFDLLIKQAELEKAAAFYKLPSTK